MVSLCRLLPPSMNAIPLDWPTLETFGFGSPGLMRKYTRARVWAAFLVTILLLLSAMGESLGLSTDAATSSNGRRSLKEHKNQMMPQKWDDNYLLKGLFSTGSSLPDCSHACGPCFPCKRVMVSFKCSIAESCPIVYRCMCNGKYYHVPSN
ncbi:uncharacterized protein LOC103717771 [Phoenix dactylifera]|uniref:Epidermal patterning factor-like protein n=1 Tax=Phoenix dactylifera TaxID=42345 RepID=A0A8B7CQY9_PHODC|nr:uncharacterized protein LOC103717771 [Phoenix dactylifera]